MRMLLLPFVIVTLLASQGKETSTHAPELVVQVFYATLQKTMSSPLPQALRALSKFLTHDFNKLIAEAVIADDAYLKKNPGEKGFLGDGTCFFYGGGDCDFSSYKVGEVKKKGERIEVHVELSVKDMNRPKNPPYTWTDVVILTRENDKWLIQDIQYFNSAASGVLKDNIEEARKEAQD